MADNVAITAGSGTNIATDEVTGTGEHVQVVKLAIAADGSRTAVPADGTDGLLVNLGTNNDVAVTGTVTANLAVGTNNIGDVDVLTVNGVAPAFGSGTRGATVQRVTIATDDSVPVTGTFWQATQPVSGTVAATQSGTWTVQPGNTANTTPWLVHGGVAHDGLDSGNPMKVGAKAVAHGSNPTAVAAADRTDLYANRHGILFTLGGHPNIITRSVRIPSGSPQTDASMVGTIAAGTKVAVTALAVTCNGANSGDVSAKVGFGASTIPADSTTGANGVLLDHDGIKPGSGVVVGSGAGLLGIGADGEELRLTCSDPASGSVIVTFSYFTIES